MARFDGPLLRALLGFAVGPLACVTAAPTFAGPPTFRVVRYGSEVDAFDRAGVAWHRRAERHRKAPFDHYAHNPGDLTARPICPPYCSPTAGYFEPCWHRLSCPPGCPSPGLLDMPAVPARRRPGRVPPQPAAESGDNKDAADPSARGDSDAPEDSPAAPPATPPAAPAPEESEDAPLSAGQGYSPAFQ